MSSPWRRCWPMAVARRPAPAAPGHAADRPTCTRCTSTSTRSGTRPSRCAQGNDIYTTPAKLTNLNPPLLTVLLTPFAVARRAHRLPDLRGAERADGARLAAGRGPRAAAAPGARRCSCWSAVLASSPLHGALVLGQIYPVLLVGLVAGWIAERRGRPVLAAVLYGITVALKPSLAPLLLLYAAQRRWAPLRAGWSSAAVASLLGVLGVRPVAAGWSGCRSRSVEPVPDTVDNASLPGLAVRFGLPPVARPGGRGRSCSAARWLVRPAPAPGRPGRHGAVGRARGRAAAARRSPGTTT